MTIKLHCFGESGNSYKAALTLELCGLDWEPVFVDFFNGATRSPDYRKINVMGEAPLMIDGDRTITQSGVMQNYAVRKSGKLGGANEIENDEILRWQFWDNHKLSSQAGMTRFLMNFIPEEKRNPDVIGFAQGRLKAAYQVLDQALDGRDWLVGDAITIADTACCGYLYYPEPFGFDRAQWPNIDRWLTNIAAVPGWKYPYDLMPGNPSDRT